MAGRTDSTIIITGYRETARALGRVNAGAKRAVFAGLRSAAEPIAADARSRLSKYAGLSTSTIRPSARITGVYVIQRAPKKTGLRPDFGSLQMRVGLIPALNDHADDVVDNVEAALFLAAKKEGF